MDAYPTVSLLDPARLDQIALRVWTKSARTDLSGRQFWARVTHYVDFIEREPRIGQFALVLGHTSADLMAFFLALVACGRLAAFFPPNSPLQDERYYFSQQKHSLDKINPSAICIFESQLAETIRQIDPSLGGRTITVPAAEIATMPAPGEPRAMAMLRARLECEQPIFVQHSSGTTGIKKAVGISGQALARQYDAYWPLIRQQAETDCLRIASWLPLYHDMGLIATFLLPALGGDTISIIDPFEWINTPGTLLEMIEADGADVCWLPNFAFRHFSRLRKALPTRNLASVKLWIDCSEPCRYADAVRFEQDFAAFGVRPGSVVGCYAMAETVFAVSQLAPGQQRALAVPHAVTVGTDMAASGALVVSEGTLVSGGHKLVLSSGPVLPGLQVRVRADGSDVPEGTWRSKEVFLF
jgi:fatty-acyl-CoA synthase